MQWFVNVSLFIFILFVCRVEGILVFSFCAIVSFAFARNLLNGGRDLDYTEYFRSKGIALSKNKEKSQRCIRRPFPSGLNSCRHSLIRNILRDFVISWYENVGVSNAFVLESRSLLEEVTCAFYDKLSKTSVNSHTLKLCIIFQRHLYRMQAAKLSMSKYNKTFVEAYHLLHEKTRFYDNNELQYLCNIVDILLFKLIAARSLSCDTGRFILREILAFKLFLPLLDTISEPDFINTSIVRIFGENSADEIPCSTTLDDTKVVNKSKLNVSTSFAECLEENLCINEDPKAKDYIQSTEKYKVQDDLSDIVNISLEPNSLEIDEICDTIPNGANVSTSDERNELAAVASEVKNKQTTSTPVINGMNKVTKQNKEKGQFSRLNSLLTSKIHGSGLAKTLRKIQSAPLLKSNGNSKLAKSLAIEESISEISNSDNASSIANDEQVYCERDGRSSSSSAIDQVDHNQENIEIFSNEDVETCDDNDGLVMYIDGQNGLLSNSGDSSGLDTNLRENDEGSIGDCDGLVGQLWDNEDPSRIGGNSRVDVGTPVDNQEDLMMEVDGASVNETAIDNDEVSRADFAIHDEFRPCSLISIPSTQLVVDHSFEPYKRKYTVYVIKYHLQLWQHSDVEDPEDGTGNECEIKRRYREFMELHHRLVCGTLSKFMKDIPKPNRKFNSPFFRLDQDVIEGRQLLLENYLKSLVNQPSIRDSEDFRGFLGIGDESKTDFKRHTVVVPNLPQVPRIDKKLKKNVTKFLDHIKTAFDSGVIDGEEEEEDMKQVFGGDKTTEDNVRSFVLCSGACKLHHSRCYSENPFQNFLSSKERLEQQPHFGESTGDIKSKHHHVKNTTTPSSFEPVEKFFNTCSASVPSLTDENKNEEILSNPLTRAVLNLSCHFMERQKSWICLEPVCEAATSVFGCFLEWWMEGFLCELVTEDQWCYYLTLLTDTVWPGGQLIKNTEQEKKSDEEISKNKDDAIRALIHSFGVLRVTVGREKVEECAREIIDSFQHYEINRHLFLEIFEVVLAEIYPELLEEKDSYLTLRRN